MCGLRQITGSLARRSRFSTARSDSCDASMPARCHFDSVAIATANCCHLSLGYYSNTASRWPIESVSERLKGRSPYCRFRRRHAYVGLFPLK